MAELAHLEADNGPVARLQQRLDQLSRRIGAVDRRLHTHGPGSTDGRAALHRGLVTFSTLIRGGTLCTASSKIFGVSLLAFLGLASCDSGLAPTGSGASTVSDSDRIAVRGEGVVLRREDDDALELCAGDELLMGSAGVIYCVGLGITGVDFDDIAGPALNGYNGQYRKVMLEGVLSGDRKTLKASRITPTIQEVGEEWPPTSSMDVVPCSARDLHDVETAGDELNRMPLGIVEFPERDATSLTAMFVDDQWFRIACAAGLRPSSVRSVLTTDSTH